MQRAAKRTLRGPRKHEVKSRLEAAEKLVAKKWEACKLIYTMLNDTVTAVNAALACLGLEMAFRPPESFDQSAIMKLLQQTPEGKPFQLVERSMKQIKPEERKANIKTLLEDPSYQWEAESSALFLRVMTKAMPLLLDEASQRKSAPSSQQTAAAKQQASAEPKKALELLLQQDDKRSWGLHPFTFKWRVFMARSMDRSEKNCAELESSLDALREDTGLKRLASELHAPEKAAHDSSESPRGAHQAQQETKAEAEALARLAELQEREAKLAKIAADIEAKKRLEER